MTIQKNCAVTATSDPDRRDLARTTVTHAPQDPGNFAPGITGVTLDPAGLRLLNSRGLLPDSDNSSVQVKDNGLQDRTTDVDTEQKSHED